MPTVKFYTLGCKVNQYETQLMREQFLNSDFREIDDHSPADLYIINTCTVTHRADSDSFSLIHRARRENSEGKVIVTGCLTELDSQKLSKEKIDLIVRNRDKPKILSFLRPDLRFQTTNFKNISYFKGYSRAFVKIQDGCNYRCSYCKVTLVRGKSQSRPMVEVISEVECLIKNNYREIVLCGICLGLYGKDLKPKISLCNLIEELEKLEGDFRIRLSSIEAQDIDDKLIERLKESKKLCKHLHIPIQSGDDQILGRMNRDFKGSEYKELIYRLKEEVLDLAITTDIMVGFPGESEENFNNTLVLIREIKPHRIHIFPFSRRENTSAFYLNPQIPFNIIKKRIQILRGLAIDISFEFRKEFLSRKLRVLVEETPDKKTAFLQGYTDNYIKVSIQTQRELMNQLAYVEIFKIDKDHTFARY